MAIPNNTIAKKAENLNRVSRSLERTRTGMYTLSAALVLSLGYAIAGKNEVAFAAILFALLLVATTFHFERLRRAGMPEYASIAHSIGATYDSEDIDASREALSSQRVDVADIALRRFSDARQVVPLPTRTAPTLLLGAAVAGLLLSLALLA